MDQTAVAAAGNETYADSYWRVFLPLARPVAIARLEQGGRLLAGMLFAAWRQAGSPTPPARFVMTNGLLPYAPDLTVTGPDDPAADYPALDDDVLDAARSGAETFTIASKRLNRNVTTTVLLPYDYDPHGSIRYPVVYYCTAAAEAIRIGTTRPESPPMRRTAGSSWSWSTPPATAGTSTRQRAATGRNISTTSFCPMSTVTT